MERCVHQIAHSAVQQWLNYKIQTNSYYHEIN